MGGSSSYDGGPQGSGGSVAGKDWPTAGAEDAGGEDWPVAGSGGTLGGGGASNPAGGATGTGGTGSGGTSGFGGSTVGSGGTSTLAGGSTGAGGTGAGGTSGFGGSTLLDASTVDAPWDVNTSPIEAGTVAGGPAVYYAFDRASQNRVADSSGNGMDGTLVGDPTSGGPSFSFVPGKLGNALRLTAQARTYVAVPVQVFAGTTDITIALWVQVTSAQVWSRLVDVGILSGLAVNNSPTTKYLALVPEDSTSNFELMISVSGADGSQRLTAPALATNVWKHVALVLGPGGALLYVDGSLLRSSAAITLRAADLGAIDYAYLGKSQFTVDPYLDGMIDEFRVYRRALGPDEIATLYAVTGP